jgi:hypothetical protein
MSGLLEQVRSLLDAAALAHSGTSQGDALAAMRHRLDEPLRVAIAGRMKAGKSTLLNALVGEELAPTDAAECTKIITWYQEGHTPAVRLQPNHAEPVPTVFRRIRNGLRVELGGRGAADIERIIVDWPTSALHPFTLIDTPGIDSVDEDVSRRTDEALTRGARSTADAVVYLLRHMHSIDVNFLEAFTSDRGNVPSPVHCVGVLARADEVGVARLDAMTAAARVAKRYQGHARVRSLCSTVIPVAGLLAQAAVTLTEDDYGALVRLAGTDQAILSNLLLDASTFASQAEGDTGGVGADVRRTLLDQLGLFGIRLALNLIAEHRARSAAELARSLSAASGIDDLRQVLLTQLAQRRDMLKARAALLSLDDIVGTRTDPVTEALSRRLEALLAGAHEFVEAGLLGVIRTSGLDLCTDELDAAERLLGGHGIEVAARLGVADATADKQSAARTELERWQRRCEDPFISPDTVRAARILVRTCEGLLRASVPTSAPPPTISASLLGGSR